MLDYLIIGHGLAGAVLSQHLLEAGKKILVIDHSVENSASKVAAGLYNPITGRKMVKTWNADALFPTIEPFYSSLEKKLGSAFFHQLGIYRPFVNVEEQNEWQGKLAGAEYSKYVGQLFTRSRSELMLNDEHGGLQLKMAGYVDVKTLLAANKKYLSDRGICKESVFYVDRISKSGDCHSYDGLKFKKVIFCTGYSKLANRYFDWLPFSPVKGEVLKAEMEIEAKTILNRGIFILPEKENQCRIGATYNWRDLTNEPTEKGRNELEEKLKKLYSGSYMVKSGLAGIRPATKDRRPFIGIHPEQAHLGVFNGFGSKGVSLIPFYAQKFVDHLESGTPLDSEVDINRYFSLS